MKLQCPQCGARYKIDTSRVSKPVIRIQCPKCGEVFQEEVDSAGRKTVLVVDDSKFFRELICDVLQPLGLHLLTAGEGGEALQLIRQQRPALVLLDLNLPGKSGYELIREVRADRALRGVRLLAMSGVFRKEEDVSAATRAGADDFISKSFKPEFLLSRVTRLLE